MAKTTSAAFAEFEGKIGLTTAQRGTVQHRTDTTRNFLFSTFTDHDSTPLLETIPMGSTERDTAVRPLDDIDVLAVFRDKDRAFEKYRYDSQAFLYRVRDRINAKTQVQNVGARGQAVRLFYDDGLHVDIAPVFRWVTGGYALPAGDGSWITTDPTRQAAWANAREVNLNYQFKTMVRLLKRWNNSHGKRLGSWHLEVLVGSVFGSLGFDHRDALMKFFEWSPQQLHVADPSGHDLDLAHNFTWHHELGVREALNSARERAQRAVMAEAMGNHAEAIRLWTIVLGSEFPAYG